MSGTKKASENEEGRDIRYWPQYVVKPVDIAYA